MNTRNIIITVAVILSLSLTSFLIERTQKAGETGGNIDAEKGFAVLELFTSEGCSSCPNADQLLGEIQKQSLDKPVYILAYHVDYWDHLGWRDIFSSADNTKRQRDYSGRLNTPLYTPQLVINGTSEFVGSDGPAIYAALKMALGRSTTTSLAIEARREGESLAIDYRVGDVTDQSNLVIALVQKNAERKIKRGENEGRTLTHVQIVREFQKIELSEEGKGTKTFNLPQDFDEQQWEVIAFLQDEITGEITSGARARL